MKTKLLFLTVLLSYSFAKAQQSEPLSLKRAVHIAWENGNAAKLAKEKVRSAELKLNITKNKQYPDFKLSGRYMYLFSSDVDLKFRPPSAPPGNGEPGQSQGMPSPHQLFLAQANLSIPLFSGFRLKNAVKAGESQYKAAQFLAQSSKGEVALRIVSYYIALYKARKTVALVEENLETAKRRVRDFTNMEQNGLLARNDLLKAKLEQSKVKLSLAKAQKASRILNYRLAVLLQLPEGTRIAIDSLSFGLMRSKPLVAKAISRPDIQALRYQQKAAKENIKLQKGGYYPSIGLTAGYLAADLENTITVTNAINVGLGISYNLAGIFKNKSKVKLAKSQADQLQIKLDEAMDQAKVAIKNAREDYILALQNYQVFKKSAVQAAENFRIVKNKFDNGLMDTRDLLEADLQQLQSKINLATGKADITLKYYMLKKAQGQLTNAFANN